jgi:hypothetical protein
MAVRASSMKIARTLVASALVFGSVLAAAPAFAHVVEVTTALDMPESRDAAAVKEALRQAVDRVLTDTIAFKPTMVALTDARMMGEKLLVRLLIADADGERMLKDLNEGDSGSASPDEDPSQPRETKI